VKAYEKDPDTGIVKHLDDQCIGCQYCVFTCPYEVPQFNAEKGIVRKCDMCTDRLAAGEAPACVQACPSQAIAIRVIDVADAHRAAAAGEFLPGTPSPAITVPTTRYVSAEPLPSELAPADQRRVRPFDAHNPLVLMLVLTQLAAGSYTLSALARGMLGAEAAEALLALVALVAFTLTMVGLGASTLHLGRPKYAFRAVLGLRTSWMSREVVAFGALSGLGAGYVLLQHGRRIPGLGPVLSGSAALVPIAGALLVPVSLVAVFTSVMIYAVTRRAYWAFGTTLAKFFGSALVLGAATTLASASVAALSAGQGAQGELLGLARGLALVLPPLLVGKLILERRVLAHRHAEPATDLSRSVLLLDGALRPIARARLGFAGLGGLVLPALLWTASVPAAALLGCALLLALLVGELCERALFFRAMASMRMPGGVA
jgi:formate dehydrogenase iron-sulfur subunit